MLPPAPCLTLQLLCFCGAAKPVTGADRDSVLRGQFLSSFPWDCRLCDRKFKLRPYLVDHSLNSQPHQAKLLQALKKSLNTRVCFHKAPQIVAHHSMTREPGSMHIRVILCTTV